MKINRIRTAAAMLTALLMLSAAMPCAAAETTAAQETTTAAAETTTSAAETAAEGETTSEGETTAPVKKDFQLGETYTCGDYTYTVLVKAENEKEMGVQIESYAGSDTDVVIPDTLDGLPVVKLGDRAFASRVNMTAVTIPASVEGFGKYTFAACPSLCEYRVSTGSSFCESRDGVLYSADGLTLLRYPLGRNPETLELEEGITSIDNVAFASSGSLKSVKIPQSVTHIGDSAFASCGKLETINLPHALTIIEPFTFNSCGSLKSVIIPANVKEIGNGAFAGSGLETVTLPDNCITIGEQAFAGTKLKEVTIPSAVSDIGYSAFGWGVDETGEMVMDESFIIRGYKGSAAEIYATDTENGDGFEFVALDAEKSAPETEPAETELRSEKMGGVRMIGIIICCALLAVIALVAVISNKTGDAKKGKKK